MTPRLDPENVRRHQQVLNDFMNHKTQEAALPYTEGDRVTMSGQEWTVTDVKASGVLVIRRQDTVSARSRLVNSRDVKPVR